MLWLQVVIAIKNLKNDNQIEDCIEERIVNKNPTISNNPNEIKTNEYYIYKGQRKEVSDFYNEWVKKNCNAKTTEIH